MKEFDYGICLPSIPFPALAVHLFPPGRQVALLFEAGILTPSSGIIGNVNSMVVADLSPVGDGTLHILITHVKHLVTCLDPIPGLELPVFPISSSTDLLIFPSAVLPAH